MKILFAASEMAPYAKTGGMGDVVGALASVLQKSGHEVTCCIPYYRQVKDARFTPKAFGAGRVPTEVGAKATGVTVNISLGSRSVTGDVLEWTQRDGVRVLFIRRDEFFDRAELYHTGVRDYEDNAERFLFFSKAVAQLIEHERFRADIVHCHDWQAAFVPVMMRQIFYNGGGQNGRPTIAKGENTKTVFTIHNIAYQGMFPSLDFSLANFPGGFFTSETLEFYGRMNLLKGGIVFSDAITTVSKTYAKEIQTTEGGFGLDTVLATRVDDLHGIVNGVDYSLWNPGTDPHLRRHYNMDDLSGKDACRVDLLERFGLGNLPLTPPGRGAGKLMENGGQDGRPTTAGDGHLVAAFVSRLTEQKGVSVLVEAMEDLVKLGLTILILGKGEREYEEMVLKAAKRFPHQVAVKIAHDEVLAHQIQAGADILLMPSHFEPCGLTQLYALKYGTIPVVHATGGLVDTVEQYNARTGGGTGFKFATYTAAALVDAVRQAILLHKQPKKWQKLMRQAMARDFSWQASAKEYEKLYAALLRGAAD